MEPIYLLDLASRKSAWLAARQAVVAANVANASTPGFKTRDVTPFKDVVAQTTLSLASTDSGHIQQSDVGNINSSAVETTDNLDVAENGNDVGVEQEMVKAGDIGREYALTTNIEKSFHNLLMASLKA